MKPEQTVRPGAINNAVIWLEAIKSIRSVLPKALYIGVLGLFLPQLIAELYLDIQSVRAVDDLRSLVAQMESTGGSYSAIFYGALTPFLWGLSINFALLLIFFGAYLGMVQLAVAALRGATLPSGPEALASGLRSLFPSGVVVVLWIMLIFTIGQLLVFGLIIIASMCLVVPVILVVEKKSATKSLFDALSMKYLNREKYSVWSGVFSLVMVSAVLYILVKSVSHLSVGLMTPDQFIPSSRELWIAELFSSLPWPYVVSLTLASAVVVCFFAILAFITTRFYFVVSKNRIDISV